MDGFKPDFFMAPYCDAIEVTLIYGSNESSECPLVKCHKLIHYDIYGIDRYKHEPGSLGSIVCVSDNDFLE